MLFAACNSEQITMPIKQKNNAKLIGIWSNGIGENAFFEIKKDSIYYVDDFISYRYFLAGDTIKIFYPDWTLLGLLVLSKARCLSPKV